MSSKKKRTQEKDRPRHTEQDPGPSESLSTVSKAYSDRKGLPRKATRILSRPGFQLLEGFRQALSPGEDGQFTYEGLRRDCGIGSRSSVAKGLNELQSLTVIEYTSERIGGKVHGLKVKLLGFPDTTSEAAIRLYMKPLVASVDKLQTTIKEIETDDETE